MLIPFFYFWHWKSIITALNAWIWIGLYLRAKEQWNEIDKKKKIRTFLWVQQKDQLLKKAKTYKLYESRLIVQELFPIAVST